MNAATLINLKGNNRCNNSELTLHYFYIYQCDKLSELGVKCAFISDEDGSGTMDIFGHERAVKFFEHNNIAGKFFSFVNGEGVALILFSPTTYYINGLNKSVLFISMVMRDVHDDRSVNDDNSEVKYQYSHSNFCTQDQAVLDRQPLPVWMKNPP